MSKSKKNVVDPQTVINLYGADAVRWFVLSDSPPERDIQWVMKEFLDLISLFKKFGQFLKCQNIEEKNKLNDEKLNVKS